MRVSNAYCDKDHYHTTRRECCELTSALLWVIGDV